ASRSATAAVTMPGAGRGCDKARGADRDHGAAPDTGGFRKTRAPPRPVPDRLLRLAMPRSFCLCRFLTPALSPQAGRGGWGRGSAGLGVGALLHLPEHLVEVEASGLLALRVFPECLQEFPDKGLRRHHQVDVVDQPIVVGDRGDVGALE